MAPSTILRSIAFSRATASAICSSSSLLALTVAMSRLLAFSLFAPPQRFDDERIGKHQARFRHVVDRQQHVDGLFSGFAAAQADTIALNAAEFAAKPAPAIDRNLHLDMRDVAGIAIEIGAPHQRPIDPRRGNLQSVR